MTLQVMVLCALTVTGYLLDCNLVEGTYLDWRNSAIASAVSVLLARSHIHALSTQTLIESVRQPHSAVATSEPALIRLKPKRP
jgi:hypothetical protein